MDPVSIAAVGWSISAVGWVISPIISKLINRCCSYLGFDASKKLEQLGPKVLLLERVMEVVEGSPYKDCLEKLCKDLKSALYEAEDILDDIEYHRLERKVRDDKLKSDERASGSKKNSLMSFKTTKDQESGMSKSRLKNNFEKIEKVIDDACEILEQLNFPSVANSDGRQVSAANSRSAVTTADPPLKVIGRDEERDKIIAMLHEKECGGQKNPNSDVSYSVIGIHGVAGSGKSTLAQYICAREKKDKEEEKDGHFHLVIWIHVSQKFDLDAIFWDMLEGATGKECPKFNSRSALVEDLKDKLRGKRIFLVLDDVWYNIRNEGHRLAELEQVLSPMMVGMTGSKVLVTSRTKDALLAGHDRIKMELIGAEIAEKLNRSPLAARTVGSRLHLKPDVAFWRMTRDQDLLKETKGALWWSYRHLDEQIRRCFAYCSIFPRRYRLDRDKLVRLWVAEGFIKATNAEAELDAIGESYFDDLLSASFLQLGVQRTVSGGREREVEHFTVHDLLRDLAEEVAGSDCFKIEVGLTGEVPQDVRHLFIETYNRKILVEKILKLQNLRTLIIDEVISENFDEVFKDMFRRLPKLRVLSVQTNKYKEFSFPESIDQLKHLRYFGFQVGSRTKLVLPSSLTNLYHIQVLDFGRCLRLVFSSGEDMNQLINLRRVSTLADLEFPNVGKLTWLQELRFFTVKNERGYELRQLKNLNKLRGKLQIHGLENVGSKDEAIEASLADKEQLAELVLCWDDGSCSPEVEAEVLEALCPSKYLERLEIRNYNGLTYPDWMVVGEHEGGPKHLQNLVLYSIQLGPPPELFEVFIHLRFLWFSRCDWEVLPDNMERLTNLKRLWIVLLEKISALPTLPLSLEEIKIESCNTRLMASCQKIGDRNWEKIKHIPKKIFEN